MEGDKAERKRTDETVHWVGQPSMKWPDYPAFCSQMGAIPGMPKTTALFEVYKEMLLATSMYLSGLLWVCSYNLCFDIQKVTLFISKLRGFLLIIR